MIHEMNPIIQNIVSRRSCRAYKPEQIPEGDLKQILTAGVYAATAMGRQSPRIVVIQDPETREILRKLNAKIMGSPMMNPFYGAPTILLVLADRKACSEVNAIKDGSIVIDNMMLAAHSLGIASCWINRADEELKLPEGQALLKKWGIEGDYIGVGHCILGYPSVPPEAPAPRKADYIVFD